MTMKTRSRTVARSSSNRKNKGSTHPVSSDELVSNDEIEEALSVKNYLRKALKGLGELEAELKQLRDENEKLVAELEKTKAAASTSRKGKSKANGFSEGELQKEVEKLRAQLKDLTKAAQKDKKKIERLELKEIKREAAELQMDATGDDEDIVDDSAYALRKLLRKFADLMASNSLEGTEECPICFEKLEVDQTVSFPCQHIFCDDCFKKITPNSELVRCPECRGEFNRDDVEMVRLTASSQWDELLKVANRFSKQDRRGEEDTSEEEASEGFLDDPNNDSENNESALPELTPEPNKSSTPAKEEEDIDAPIPITPHKKRLVLSSSPEPPAEQSAASPMAGPSSHPLPALAIGANNSGDEDDDEPLVYAKSPSALKRKKMQALAELRSQKRQRL
ncbi:hypothetical protein C8Q75DRAFT_223876 [Abortiporus biennis]|nr:hypothetical protein C8Q75DRAFT_223876 [Abortiporus biennis]